jgi:hypothetical protein
MRTCSLLLLFFLLLPPSGRCGRDSARLARSTPLSLYFEPSGLLSVYHSAAIRAGGEVPLGGDFGLNMTGLYYRAGWGAKMAVKKYLRPEALSGAKRGSFAVISRRSFLAAELFFKSYRYTATDSLRDSGDLDYAVSKSAWTLSLQYGQVRTLRNGMYYEWFAGLGIRVKTVANNLRPEQQRDLHHWHEGIVISLTDANAYRKAGPHIALGLRVGYRFR